MLQFPTPKALPRMLWGPSQAAHPQGQPPAPEHTSLLGIICTGQVGAEPSGVGGRVHGGPQAVGGAPQASPQLSGQGSSRC